MIRNNNFFNDTGLASYEEFTQRLSNHRYVEKVKKSGVPLLVQNNQVFVDDTDVHTLIYGNTGTKKTRNFVIPTIYSLGNANESMIISDPKGEIYNNTSGYLASQGYDIKVINLRQPKKSSCWNPILLPYRLYMNGEQDKAFEMISNFCVLLANNVHNENDMYWETCATALLEGIILLLFELAKSEEQVNMCNVQQLRMTIQTKDDKTPNDTVSFWDFYEVLPNDSIAKYRLSGTYSIRNTDKTLSCVLSIFDTMLSPFLKQHDIMEMMSISNIDYEDICTKKYALYIIVPDEKKTYHFVISIFVKQLYEYLIYYAQTQKNGQIPNRINFILDEFANITKIEDMSSMISAARSRNIRFVLIVQSKRQLYSLYSDDADTIRANCQNWIFLSCREVELLQELEQLCGDIYVEGRGYIHTMSVSKLQRLQIGWEDSQALVLKQSTRPFISNVKDFSYYPQANYKELPLIDRPHVEYPIMVLNKVCVKVLQYKLKNKDSFENDEKNIKSYEELF